MLVQPKVTYQARIFRVKQLIKGLSYEIHVETISLSTKLFGQTRTKNISSRNSIMIISHLSLNSHFFIKPQRHTFDNTFLSFGLIWKVPRCVVGINYRYLLVELVPLFTTCGLSILEICNVAILGKLHRNFC